MGTLLQGYRVTLLQGWRWGPFCRSGGGGPSAGLGVEALVQGSYDDDEDGDDDDILRQHLNCRQLHLIDGS